MMKVKKTPWTLMPDDVKAFEEQKKYLEHMRKKAQACMLHEDFAEYKKMFMEYKARIIEEIIYLSEPDPVLYAFKVRQLVDTLKSYRLLISSVEEDANRKV